MLFVLVAIFLKVAGATEAQDLVTALQRQNFQCENSHCRGNISSYSLPINIFVPPQFQRRAPVLLAYHLHGWWQNLETTPFDGPEGDFLRFATESRRNVLILVPESHGKNETYANELDTPEQMILFFAQVERVLNRAGVVVDVTTPRTLSGHSGAYVQMGKMGDWARSGAVPVLRALRGFALLDSAYSYRDGLTNVMEAMCLRSRPVYLLAFNPTDGQAQKRDTNNRIAREITNDFSCGQRVFHYPNSTADHGAFPRLYLAAFLNEAAK